jgi:superkiller protein 3
MTAEGPHKRNFWIKAPHVLAVSATIIALVVLPACVPQFTKKSAEMQKMVETHYDAGVTYLNDGKTPQALKELLEAQRMAPDNANVMHALAMAYQQKGLYDESRQHYLKAIALDPKLTEARNNLGTLYLIRSEFDQAIVEFETCLKDPEYLTPEKALYNLGVAYFNKKDLDKSIHYYDRSLQIMPDQINALHNVGFCYELKKDFAQAANYYKRALAVEPDFKEALFRLGTVRMEQADYTDAVKHFRKALKLDPDYLPALYQLGRALVKAGDPKEGANMLEEVAQKDPQGELGKKAAQELSLIKVDKFRGIPSPPKRPR